MAPAHLLLVLREPGHEQEKASFGWAQRFKVAMGVAEALDYLHGAGKPVIHRDVKSSNILLSDDYEPRVLPYCTGSDAEKFSLPGRPACSRSSSDAGPQLADFGLAQWESSSSSHAACSDVAGTFG